MEGIRETEFKSSVLKSMKTCFNSAMYDPPVLDLDKSMGRHRLSNYSMTCAVILLTTEVVILNTIV